MSVLGGKRRKLKDLRVGAFPISIHAHQCIILSMSRRCFLASLYCYFVLGLFTCATLAMGFTVRRKAHTRVDETVATDGAPYSPSTETHALNQLLHTILKSALLLATKEQIARAAASAVFFGGSRSGAAGSTRPRP